METDLASCMQTDNDLSVFLYLLKDYQENEIMVPEPFSYTIPLAVVLSLSASAL
jgi:hypothetical protein